ncbi:nicotinamide phosphoribosyltransferase [Dermacentor silvarum]|uniref:nicotinamide phosphoribosyltransferase n=1 Tax=Dermacentor silvarum TaxID=543639 RepID=UPI00210197BF|nr:nicotinamide phosphoribosyltransferase [Dermacentor silvarum]
MGCGSAFRREAPAIAQAQPTKEDGDSTITRAGSGLDVLTIGSDFGLSKWDEAACGSDNVILLTDSSRVCHYLQYPEGTTFIYSYFESIGSKYDKTLFFGLQYVLKKWMVGPVITVKKINDAKEFFRMHFNQELFNESGWMHIVEQHDGHLPLSIRAVPEGSLIPTRNVLFTVENTDPEVPWLTGWFQTLFMQTWYPTTVATNAWHYKEIMARYLLDTCGSTASIPYQLHDFGSGGASSVESAAIGGAAHLVNFLSSDNIAGIRLVHQYYGLPMAGYSYPSTEHSTMTPWGPAGESAACRQAMHAFPSGPASVASDTYHAANCCEHVWGQDLRHLVEARAELYGGMLIVRLQSGDPPEIIVEVLEILGRHYSVTVNSLGFRELPPYVRLMHSDGMTLEMAEAVLANAKAHRWSAQNVLLASDGTLMRDPRGPAQRFAFQCSAAIVGGHEKEVHRNPMTDTGLSSKKGRLTLQHSVSGYTTVEHGQGNPEEDCLVHVFKDGHLLVDQTFEDIRRRSQEPLDRFNT